MTRGASAREVRLTCYWIAAPERCGCQIGIPSNLSQEMNVSREIGHLAGRQIIARHRRLQIRPARAHDGAEQLTVLVGANERTAKEVACAHHGTPAVRSVTAVTMIQNVNRTASLQHGGRCGKASGIGHTRRRGLPRHGGLRGRYQLQRAEEGGYASAWRQYSRHRFTSSTENRKEPYSYSR